MRNQSKKFRELIAFGETPDRWEWDVKNLRDSGDLLNPEADTERLMGLYETKDDLIPGLDATDHALDYLDELEKEGANANAPTTAFDALNSYTGQAGQAPGVSGTAPLIRDAVLRYDPGQDALPQATTALYNPEQLSPVYNGGAASGLFTPIQDTQGGASEPDPENPPAIYRDNALVPPIASGAGKPPAQSEEATTSSAPQIGVPQNRDRDNPSYLRKTPEDFSPSVKAQIAKPGREFGEFYNGVNLINHTREQEALSMIGRQHNPVPPHLFVPPREQDVVLNDPSHKYNVYANATPEERGVMNQAAYDKSLAMAEKWVLHRKALKETPKKPKLTKEMEANVMGTFAERAGKAVRKLPGVKELSGSDDAFYKTLVQHDYDPDDAESVAIATMDPKFQQDLRKNIDEHWLDTAGDALRKLLPF